MIEDDRDGLHHLIEKELNSNDKILKPDFSQKTGRELLVYYLQSKFKQLIAFDKMANNPIFSYVGEDFLKNFSSRLVLNPKKRIMIGVTGESASGKSTLCKAISNVIRSFKMPVSILPTDSYFNDISDLIKKYGSFDNLRDNGYDVDSPESFQLDILEKDLKVIYMLLSIYRTEQEYQFLNLILFLQIKL